MTRPEERELDDDGDERVWARAREGDDRAFGVVFDRHVDRVHRHARRLAPGEADAEDIVALTFFELWRSRHRVRVVDGSVIAWLLVTATNVSRNLARSRRRAEQMLRGLRPEAHPDPAGEVHDRISRDELRMPVRAAFDALSSADQQILALCVIEELRPREVALMLRVPSATIRARLSRAKARLRAAIEAVQPGAIENWLEAMR